MNYSKMYDRNIGVWTKEEQEIIRSSKVTIIGCGGMGSIAAQIAARTGIEKIVLADPDKYEEVNINNQYNAFTDTIGKNKAVTVSECVTKINPNIVTTVFQEGLTDDNVNETIKDASVIFDCVDYNELYYSYILNRAAREQGIYVLAPQAIGYGASVLVFDPNGLSFNEYLGLSDELTKEDFNKILASPEKYAAIIPSYISKEIINKVVKKEIPIPNIALAQTLAASIMVSEALLVLLGKRKPVVVPDMIAIDLFDKKVIF